MPEATSVEVAVLIARGRHGFHGKGKLRPRKFLPALTSALAALGVDLRLAATEEEAQALLDGAAQVAINVFNELHEVDDIVIADADLPPHFAINPLSLRDLLNDKRTLSRLYKENGIPTPDDSTLGQDGFQIYATGSGVPPKQVPAGATSTEQFHVTKFIDTSRAYRGQVFRTYVRLFTVGPHLIAANVGLRPWSEADLSVHLIDTPLDAEMINYFQGLLVERNLDRLEQLAVRLGQALGPGIFAHDVLIETETRDIFVCESGIKFEIGSVDGYFAPIQAQVPALKLHTDTYAKRMAAGIVRCVKDHGLWDHV